MRKETKKLAIGFLKTLGIGILAALSVVFFWKESFLLLGILLVISIVYLYLEKSKKSVLLYICCSVAGSLVEIVSIEAGAWAYTRPELFGAPYWLFPLWGIASIFMKRLYLHLGKLVEIMKK